MLLIFTKSLFLTTKTLNRPWKAWLLVLMSGCIHWNPCHWCSRPIFLNTMSISSSQHLPVSLVGLSYTIVTTDCTSVRLLYNATASRRTGGCPKCTDWMWVIRCFLMQVWAIDQCCLHNIQVYYYCYIQRSHPFMRCKVERVCQNSNQRSETVRLSLCRGQPGQHSGASYPVVQPSIRILFQQGIWPQLQCTWRLCPPCPGSCGSIHSNPS